MKKRNIQSLVKRIIFIGIIIFSSINALKGNDTLQVKFQISGLCVKSAIQFTDQTYTNGTVSSWLWKFGDGDTATTQHATHIFKWGQGQYRVVLIVKLTSGLTDSFVKQKEIISTSPAFTHTPPCELPGIVHFANLTSWTSGYKDKWIFDDSIIIHNQLVSIVKRHYATPGKHSLSLVVSDTNGCVDTFYKEFDILHMPQEVDFSFSPTKSCSSDTIFFISTAKARSTDTIDYYWDFGDGTVSTAPNPWHMYSASGSDLAYMVSFSASIRGNCMDSAHKLVPTFASPQAVNFVSEAIVIGSNAFIKLTPSRDGVNPLVEKGVKYDWVVYRNTTDSIAYLDTSHIYIPDTFTTSKGVRIWMRATNNGGCRSHFQVFHFAGIENIHGTVFDDLDTNGVFNGNDTAVDKVLMQFSGKKNKYYAASDENGRYKLTILAGDTLDVQCKKMDHLKDIYKSTGKIDFSIPNKLKDTIIDIPIRSTGYRDARVLVYGVRGNALVKGDTIEFIVELSNNGTTKFIKPKLVVGFDPRLTNFSSSSGFNPVSGKPNYRRLTASDLPKFATQRYRFKLIVNPDSNQINETRKIWVYLENHQDDDTSNDRDMMFGRIRTAYDPNSKFSYPSGPIDKPVTNIEYTILFQNEGNWEANTVELRDTLDPRFLLMSMVFKEATAKGEPTRNFSFNVENENTLVFRFQQIKLPPKDKTRENEKLSTGSVRFVLNLATPLKNGDEVRNRAGIYFDYEKAVLTPWAIVRRDDSFASIKHMVIAQSIKLYPNPASNSVHLDFGTQRPGSLQLLNAIGQQVFEVQVHNTQVTLDVSNVGPGIYWIRTGDGRTISWIKE